MDNLDEYQNAVVSSSASRLVVLAGAGTGKTHTLISRMVYLVRELKVDPGKILALTFTHAAALEMSARFSKYLKDSSVPEFCTFHSYCYKLICQDVNIRRRLGYTDIPAIISEEELKIYQAKAEMLTSSKLPKRAYSVSYEPSQNEKFTFKVFHKTLKNLLIQDNKITFDLLCYEVCKLFEGGHELVRKYLNQYYYIFVDEFQDTDRYQWEFVKSFKNSSILVCGDVNQAIYQFRGADSSIIKNLINSEDWKKLKLECNYRSTVQICSYVNSYLENSRNLYSISLKSSKIGPPIRTIHRSDLITHVKGDKSKTLAILCRTNKEVEYLSNTFKFQNIPIQTKFQDSYLKACLAAVDDNFLCDYLLSQIPEFKRMELLRKKYLNSNYDLENQLKILAKSAYDEVLTIQESDNFGELLLLYQNDELLNSSVSSVNSMQSGVYIGTIHSVKGLEFDSVYVYGPNSQKSFMLNSEVNCNLFYVACTRAISQLTIVL